MRLLKLMTLVAVMTSIYTVQAQHPKRANIWYFGINAGLDFTNGNPVALTNGAMQASEGIAVACNAAGNLQFYTNGGDLPNTGAIWNKNHQVMPNGYLGHTGCASSMQSSATVNLPGSSSIYYLFTTDCYENGLENGLAYSIIDMNLDGGLGDIVEKGLPLVRNTNESLTIAPHANGKEYWVITHKANTDSFYVFQLTSAGIIGVVKSKVGPVADESAGEIKVSANGERLVFAANLSFTGLFDFDASTGRVSNFRNLNVANGFAACFSPNCELLYVSSFINQRIYQFDMLAYNVAGTKTLIASPSNYVGSLQMGPDEKIYGAMRNSQYLVMISRPNIKGTDCNFVENGLHLGGKLSKYGLPNFPSNTLGECVSYPVENVSEYDFALRWENIGANTATVIFNNYPGANEYRIDYRRTGSNEWESVSSTTNVHAIEGLSENTEYETRMNKIIFEGGEYEFLHHHNFAEVIANQNEKSSSLKIKTLGASSLNLYPIPARETVSVQFSMEQNTQAELFITDLSGKTIFRQYLDNTGFQKLEIPTVDFPNGSYQLTIKSNERNENRKFIVMN